MLSSWILHVRFLSLLSLLAFMICFWQRTIKLQSLGSSRKWASNCFSTDSIELSSILDCFGDQITIKNTKTYTIWLEMIAKVPNMLIELKCNNYYSKVFNRVNYKLQNNTFWVVITSPNRQITNPLAMKERKIKINSTIIYNIMLVTSKNFKWHEDQTLTWNIKEINSNFNKSYQILCLITIHKEKTLCKLKLYKSFPLPDYYQKVLFCRPNYNGFKHLWVVITLPNRHIASPLAMKERKIQINSTIIYNIMLDQ